MQGIQGTQGLQGIQGISGASILGTANTFSGVNTFSSQLIPSSYSSGTIGVVTSASSIKIADSGSTYAYGISTNAAGGLDNMANQASQPVRIYAGTYAGSGGGTPTLCARFESGGNAIYQALSVTGTLSATGLVNFTASGENTYGNTTGGSNGISINSNTTGNPYFVLRQNSVDKAVLQYIHADSSLTTTVGSGVTKVSTTGLAVTGTLSATGAISTSGTETNVDAVRMGSAGRYGMGFNTGAGGYFNIFSHQTATRIGIGFDTGSYGTFSEKLTVLAGGNVGIGTTSPSSKLQVVSGEMNTALFHQNVASNSSTLIVRQTGAGGNVDTNQGLLVQVQGNASSNIADFAYWDGTNSTSRMLIRQNGNVGIGTTSPDAGAKLTVAGGILATGNFSATTGNTAGFDYLGGALRLFAMGTSGATKGAYSFIAKGADGSSSTPMTIDSSGNVGIGTTSPGSSTKLFVNGQSTLKRLQKQVYNWYTTSGSSYVHFKTTLKLSGAGAHTGMWSWRFYGYSYASAKIIDSYFGLHGDTSGNIYSATYQDQGEVAFCTHMYKSSDNFLVIVGLIDNTYFFGLDVDIHHTMDYSYMELGISTHAQSTNTTGVY